MGKQVRRARGHCLVLGLVGGLVTAVGSYAAAQTPTSTSTTKSVLTVRPREMATATRTRRAGWQTLDGKRLLPHKPWWLDSMNTVPELREYRAKVPDSCCFTMYFEDRINAPTFDWRKYSPFVGGMGMGYNTAVYVPKACVGARRCPLLIMNDPERYYASMADRYGMIVASLRSSWFFPLDSNRLYLQSPSDSVAAFDRDLRRLLQTFAIDPDKIALAIGRMSLVYGVANPTVFSRVITSEQMTIPEPSGPGAPTQEILYGANVFDMGNFAEVQKLRERGYHVTYSAQPRIHQRTDEEHTLWGQWLRDSWTTPRTIPPTFGDPPLLTVDIVTRMTTFWTRFLQLPESISMTARKALVREIRFPVGKELITSMMVDMPALAAKYPAVAALLKAAQLTPAEHEVYRAALLGTLTYSHMAGAPLGVEPTSAWAKNLDLFMARPDIFQVDAGVPNLWSKP